MQRREPPAEHGTTDGAEPGMWAPEDRQAHSPVPDPSHSPSHGHGHGHGPVTPASRRVRRLLFAVLAPLAVLSLAAVTFLYPWGGGHDAPEQTVGTPVDGVITAAAAGPCLGPGEVRVGEPRPDDRSCLTVEITLSEGPAEGRAITKAVPVEPSSPRFAVDDEVVLAYSGADPTDPSSYQLRDFQRGLPLLVLGALFAGAVILLGRRQGFAALVSLVLSFGIIALFILPAILAGENPLVIAIAGSALIMFVTLYVTHGFSARTSVAVLGTMASLTLIGVLAALFAAMANLTGLDDNTSSLIGALGHGIDARGLLLAGVVIGALGVLDDVTVTQASSVWELRRANPALGRRELYTAALRIGRDHVGSAVNTLVLAYAGAALPLLLLAALSDIDLSTVLQSQDVAQEIVRTLAGSIGIIAAVPLTTLLAAVIVVHDDPSPGEEREENSADAGTGATRDTTAEGLRISRRGSPRTG